MTTFIVVVPDTLGVGRLRERQGFLLDVDQLRILAHSGGLGDAELQEKVEVEEATMLLYEVSEVELRVLSVILNLDLAKYAENTIRRIGWPASVHGDRSAWCVVMAVASNIN